MENLGETSSVKALARQIDQGECVLVLGPGVSTDTSDSIEVPLHVKLAREWANSRLRREERKDLNTDDLRYVAQVLLNRKKRGIYLLQDDVVDYYKQFSGKTTEFHRSIAALPFRLCITTSPDDFLYEALRGAGKFPVRDFYNFRGPQRDDPPEPTATSPLVYHLYGYPKDPRSLVITENDLIDFLINIIKGQPPLPKSITSQLKESERSCLFVDLGFKNWYLRVLMRSLELTPEKSRMPSVALEEKEFFEQSKQHQTTVYFSGIPPIEFYKGSLNDFALRLRQQYELMAAPDRPPAAHPPPDAPLVFLSYASEDVKLVDDLAGKLTSGGIEVWQDKQKLRAGDDWGQQLMHVIDKKVNYVVVVQTMTMLQRPEGVYLKEIRQALERQKGIQKGLRFVVPVRYCDDNLEDLKDLHSISIATDAGFQQLIDTIREDWKARPSRERAAVLTGA